VGKREVIKETLQCSSMRNSIACFPKCPVDRVREAATPDAFQDLDHIGVGAIALRQIRELIADLLEI
jgi:hypothetical protein